ncbi:MAG: acyl-CoA thioesterase, partial [Bacteroidota bacterium]
MEEEIVYKNIVDSEVILSILMQPSHSNFGGKIHGGYILSLMDQIAFACASKHSRAYCVTASVDTVDFRNPIEIGELVTMKASINYVGRSSMVVGIRVESENIQSGFVKHCNSSYFTMVAKNEEGKTIAVPGLVLQNEMDVKRFVKSIRRIEAKKHQKKAHESIDVLSGSVLDSFTLYFAKLSS